VQTFVAAVDVPDLIPGVVDDDIAQCSRVLRPHVQLVGDLLTTGVDRHAGRHERHPERSAVRLDRVERVGHVSRVERVDAARHHLAYCTHTGRLVGGGTRRPTLFGLGNGSPMATNVVLVLVLFLVVVLGVVMRFAIC